MKKKKDDLVGRATIQLTSETSTAHFKKHLFTAYSTHLCDDQFREPINMNTRKII